MRRIRDNMQRRKWVIMALDEVEDVVLPPCLFGVCEYASIGGFLFFVFVFLFLMFLCIFGGEKKRMEIVIDFVLSL